MGRSSGPEVVEDLTAKINSVLPQTQCTRCGYADCSAYALAIARDHAPINQCPPGGAEGIDRLARVTGRPFLALNPVNGREGPRAMAVIDEDWCIGCTLCLAACPTDAIVGANKLMHTVIAMHCTGCELCVPVCPVDCIKLETTDGQSTGWAAWTASQAVHARARYESRKKRVAAEHRQDLKPVKDESPATKQTVVSDAIARARRRRAQ